MATSPKTPTNKQYAAFPSLFKRTGEARRIKGFRASRTTFTSAMRRAKALDGSHLLTVMTPIGAMVLSKEATELLKEDGGVASLLINGFEIFPSNYLADEIDGFVETRSVSLKQAELFESEAE